MSGKTVVDSKATTTSNTVTEKDGTIIEYITTTYNEKYSDGTVGNRMEQKIIKKPPPTVGTKNGPGLLNPNLTPESSKAPKVPNVTEKAFIDECLLMHNSLRAKHGAPALTLDDNLGKIAQAWAGELIKKNKMAHNDTGFGENVYWNTELPTGSRAAEMWYSEIKDYDFSKNAGQKGTGHFTQLVWADSKKVGIAMAVCPDLEKGYYVVANYYPAGNVLGKYTENVKPVSIKAEAAAAGPAGLKKKSILKKK